MPIKEDEKRSRPVFSRLVAAMARLKILIVRIRLVAI